MMPFRAGRYHRIPYHQLEEARKQLGVKFYEYEELMTFDKYLDYLKMFKHLGTDYWYAHKTPGKMKSNEYLCKFGFVNQKDALAFKLMLE